MGYSDQQIEDLRERADIVAIVGRRVQLQKRGKDHLGLCPFHGEHTPSFNVIPGKHFWHCFGCGESGDIFKFFMKLDGLSFVDALKHVAQESGIILVEEKTDPEEARRRARLDELASLMDRAVRFYEQKLWHESGRAAQEHLKKRGILDDYARRFHLGFGGAGFSELSQALAKAGVPIELATEAGLCIPGQRRGTPYDRFHGRLIVPIRVPRPPDGRSIALGGRYLEGITDGGRGQRPGQKPVKYINSPSTPLYEKSHVLFGLDQARDAIRKEERAVVVEGYFDVIGVHQAGLQTAVATCGTSLTASHLDLLLRSAAREIIFLFDGDSAGLRAAARAAEMCARSQVPAKVATLPDGLDPDEYARQRGLESLLSLLERAKPAVEMLIDKALDALGPSPTVEEKVRAVQQVREIVLAAPTEFSRDLYFNQIAERLHVDKALVREAITSGPQAPAAHARSAQRSADRGPHGPVGPRRGPAPRPPDEPPMPSDTEASPPSESESTAPPSANLHARQTMRSEVSIAVTLLKFPTLAAIVAQEGVLADFGHPALRALVERVIEQQQEGAATDAPQLLAGVEDAPLRDRIRNALVDPEATLDQAEVHLKRVLVKLQTEVHRQRSKSAWLAARSGPALTEAAQQARLQEGQATLERERIRRKRSQDSHT